MKLTGKFSAVDVAGIVHELRGHVLGTYLQKFYRAGNSKRYLFRFSTPKPWRHLLVHVGTKTHFVSDDVAASMTGTTPRDGFASKLKKHLANGRVVGIAHVSGAKYFEMRFSRFTLAFDFYGQGNLVLLDGERTVLASWHPYLKARTPAYEKDLPEDVASVGRIVDGGVLAGGEADCVRSDTPPRGRVFSRFSEALTALAWAAPQEPAPKKRRVGKESRREQGTAGQVRRWSDRVRLLTEATEWLGARAHEFTDDFVSPHALPHHGRPFQTLEHWFLLRRNADAKLRRARAAHNRRVVQAKSAPPPTMLVDDAPRWYQKYHWCFTHPQGLLVVGGKTDKQNQEIVDKYLGKHDLYFHADTHGASSVVLRCGTCEPDPSSIQQAGMFAACRSSSWKSYGLERPFFVRAAQVSRSAPSGEYLSTGSFMIRGKKTYLPQAALVMGVAITDERKLCCGPFASLRHLETCVKLVPGPSKKSKTIQKAKTAMGRVDTAYPLETWQQVVPDHARVL